MRRSVDRTKFRKRERLVIHNNKLDWLINYSWKGHVETASNQPGDRQFEYIKSCDMHSVIRLVGESLEFETNYQ